MRETYTVSSEMVPLELLRQHSSDKPMLRIATWPTPIPVSERLPDIGMLVLAYNARALFWSLAIHCGAGIWDQGGHKIYVTHWLDLPPVPKE